MSPFRLLAALAALSAAAPVASQTALVEGSPGASPSPALVLGGGIEITQNVSTVVERPGVSCAFESVPFTTDNSYYRVFRLGEEAVPDQIRVTRIDMGIGGVNFDSFGGESVETQVILHTLAPSSPSDGQFRRDDLTEVARVTYSVTDVPDGVYTVDFPAANGFSRTDRLVVEWAVPTGSTESSGAFGISTGNNDDGATGSTYLSTVNGCGGIEPTGIERLGFPNSHWVMVVHASAAVAGAEGPALAGVRLGAAVPNPSSGAAAFAIYLDAPSAVRLSVHDVLGREVAVLADGPLGAGVHTARVRAGALPAGVYVARLRTPAGTSSQPLTVAR